MLKLKEQYKDAIITRGNITFDATKIYPIDYEKYVKIGFHDIFEEKLFEFKGVPPENKKNEKNK